MLTVAGHREREAAVVAEAVQHFARGIAASGEVVLALVKEGAGLLSPAQIVNKTDSVFFGDDLFRNFTMQDAYALLKAFEQSHLWIVP